MCGIVGIVGSPATRRGDPLGAALHVLAPRGPDGSGRTSGALGVHPVRFGVRRLELVGTGGGPSQPVERPDGGRLVLNGEIYNHDALRAALEREGESFPDGGDAEVLAACLARWGTGGLSRVEGSYAFAWLPGDGRALLLGRDPLGVRPLVFAPVAEGLVFASTLDALRATGAVVCRPDHEALVDVLRDGVIPTRRTALSGVRRVAPGEIVSLDADLRIASVPRPAALGPDEGEALDPLEALRAAVRDRMQTRRGMAVFLSGGIDSALVAALAREVGDVTAYTLTFGGHDVDEAHRARRTARRLGLVQVEVPCPRDPLTWVLATAAAFDEPFADASAIPTWGLGLAAARSVRVALTGTGGDEVFGGYRRYWLLGAGPWLRQVPRALREPVARVLERGLPEGARLLRAAADPGGLYRGLLRLQSPAEARTLLGPCLARVEEQGVASRRGPRHAAEAMADDLAAYLPDDLLVKEDRALAAHGIEGRHPFLDRRVRRAAGRVELRGGPGRGRQKQILRAFVREVVDPDLARVPKRGFAFPVDTFYRGPLRGLAGDLLGDRRTRERGFIASSAALRLLQQHVSGARDLGSVLHALVMLELWARRVLDGTPVLPGAL